MPKLSRPALLIAACVFLCALVMLCVTQLSAVRLAPADLGIKAGMADVVAVASIDAAAADTAVGAGHTGSTDDVPGTPASLADLSSELSEPLAPVPAMLRPAVRPAQPAAPLQVALPQPLIEGPQRPPRPLRA